MRRPSLSALGVAAALTVATLAAPGLTGAASAASPVTTQTTFRQKVPVNVVLVGYPGSVARSRDLAAGLPATYTPVVRSTLPYGIAGRDVGLEYSFDYSITSAGDDFSNRFFGYLRSTGRPGPLTDFQQQYNDQKTNILDVKGPVLRIDGPATEKWLEQNARTRLGIDGAREYTVFLVNWYSRPDFRFHVYTKTDTTDPDTGYNFGTQRQSRAMISWGGSSGRSWFYDFSAGPEAWSNNDNVDDADLDGDGAPDYRIPPAWEYGKSGYRDASKLPSDMARLVRYVGINLMFTTSPLYDPLASSPEPNGGKTVAIDMFEDDANPAVSGTRFLDTRYVKETMTSFEPYYDWRVTTKSYDPIDAKAQRSLRIWAGLSAEDDCWKDYGDRFAQLYCYFDANLGAYTSRPRPADYTGKVFAFNTTDANMGANNGLLGYADDNWTDGTPSYVFAFDTPDDRTLGFGFSTTVTHEFGHHVGMSHPHDGYDSETGTDYEPTGDFQFAWSGDETDTVMSYMGLSNTFDVFDRDNLYRWETAGYLNEAAALTEAVLASPSAGKVGGLVATATKQRAAALAAFARWDYRTAATEGHNAYESMARAARTIGVWAASPRSTARLAPHGTLHKGEPRPYPTN
ncbi:MAG: hypothetical protein WAL50_05630 [Kineosporiaceae bacterium]